MFWIVKVVATIAQKVYSRFKIWNTRFEIRAFGGTGPVSGSNKKKPLDKCILSNQSDFLEQPLVNVLVWAT